MARLSANEFMEKVKTIIGDRDDDEALSFLEDCKDTITEDKDDWKAKYDEAVKEKENLDKEWRTKYKERFYSSDSHTDTDNHSTNPAHLDNNDDKKEIDPIEEAEKVRFDDLFKPVEN